MINSDLAAEIECLHKLIEELTKRVAYLEACTPFTLGSTDLSQSFPTQSSPALAHLNSLGLSDL